MAKELKYLVVIPARYASTRFPGKPLALLGGKPVIQRVYEQVAGVVEDVVVATDDERIYSAVEAFEKASATLLANRAAKVQAKQNSKQHIKSGGGKAATPPSSIPQSMMKQVRDMFPDKTRAELEQLYKNVT